VNGSTPRPPEPRGLVLTDLFGLITGVSFAAAVGVTPVLALYLFSDPAPWLAVFEFAWGISFAISWGATCALWARNIRYDRVLRPGEWLLILHAALLLDIASLFIPDALALPHGTYDLLLPAAFLVLLLFVVGLARMFGARTRLWLRIPYWLLFATMLWLLYLPLHKGLFEESFYYHTSPNWNQWPEVLYGKLSSSARWLWTGWLFGIPLALVWLDRVRLRETKFRWTEWTGITLAIFDLAMGLVRQFEAILYQNHIWWTELIWMVPTVVFIVVGSWIGARAWRRWVPYCPSEQRTS